MDKQKSVKVSRQWILAAIGVMAWGVSVAADPMVAGRVWRAEPQGTVTEGGVDFDIEDDLQMSAENVPGLWVAAFGLIARYQPLSFSGRGAVSVSTVIETPIIDIPLGSQNVEFTSRVDLDEYTLGWLPLNFGGLRLGAAVKKIEGVLDAEEQDAVASYQVDETFPLAALSLHVPLTDWGLAFVADGQWVSYDDDTVYEFELGWARDGDGLQVALGYRKQRYDIVDGDEALDATIDGLFATLGWQF